MAQTTLDQRMLGVGTALTDHTITASDVITFADVGDSNLTKKDTVQGVLDLASAQPNMGTKVASTSGTSIDFTSIPAGTRQIVLLIDEVSLSGNAELLVQLGDSGGVETSGYGSVVFYFEGNSAWSNTPVTNGLTFMNHASSGGSASDIQMSGVITAYLVDGGTYNWVMWGHMQDEDSNEGAFSTSSKTLSAELDRIRLTTTNGTDTFDHGNVNIHYW